MRRGGFSVSVTAIYLIVGVVVAAVNDYFDRLGNGYRIGEAILAVLLWPLVLFGVDIDLK